MLRGLKRLRDPEPLLKLADGHLAGLEQLDDAQPHRMGDGLEDLRGVLQTPPLATLRDA